MSRRKWSRGEVLETILALHQGRKDLSSRQAQKHHNSLYKAAWRWFGGWKQAITAARVDYKIVAKLPSPRTWNKELILKEIRRRLQEGQSLKPVDIRKSDRGFYDAIEYHFETINQALGKVSQKIVSRERRWTKRMTIRRIKSLSEKGIRLASGSVRKSHPVLFTHALKLFGDWGTAVESAGISYRQHSRKWSTKAWLRNMQQGQYESILQSAQTHAAKHRHKKRRSR